MKSENMQQSVRGKVESSEFAPSPPKPRRVHRRAFLRGIGMGAALLAPGTAGLFASNGKGKGFKDHGSDGNLSKGDAALLRFAAAAEILETDLWVQYNELAGVIDSEEPSGSGNPAFTQAVKALDGDMDIYIHDNTDDEFTHFTFLNAYLASKGAQPVNLEKFRTLPGSTATGSSGILRLTNLMQLTIDTSWWTRYRDPNHNPDLDPSHVFPQAVPSLFVGQHTAIPRTDADTTGDPNFLQAIANTAGFHFPTIEQGGTSLYPAMAQRAKSTEVLRILISIGPTETMHFQTWQDKAGNAPPLNDIVDPVTNVHVTFPDLTQDSVGELFKNNLIMPEPCPFISPNLPVCSIIRPTATEGIAMGVVKFLTDMGLFIGQTPEFFQTLHQLAADADAAGHDD
jgi:hypothetical protein